MDFFLLVSGALCPIRGEGGRGEKKDSYLGVVHCYVYFCVGCLDFHQSHHLLF